ncbi:MAG: DUF2071 domain-containing protein [Cytophagaceae bacterium]|jgi:hypothetical protein|nr:DUF2071 domain-containing protein [Cytophagaceae bacterium]
MAASIFLKADWKHLLMINYEINPEILQEYLPAHTELDTFENKHLVSLVGFMFENTRVKSIKIPGHINFEEFNLRFYVKRKEGNAWKRGVVFIKEIVPKPLIALVARYLYREPYVAMPMRHTLQLNQERGKVEYVFGKNNFVRAHLAGSAYTFQQGSIEEFITEHYWGYNRFAPGITMEYGVEHPSWKILPVQDVKVQLDVEGLYGPAFTPFIQGVPHSAFLAEGSSIIVRSGKQIRA